MRRVSCAASHRCCELTSKKRCGRRAASRASVFVCVDGICPTELYIRLSASTLFRSLPSMKTSDVRSFVQEVLHAIHQPYTEHVIEDVFYAIEHRPEWMSEYESLCEMLGKTTVNTWGGRWIAITLGKSGEKQVTSKRCSILGSYSLLDADAKPVTVKPKEEAALQLMADYYFANKDRLPSDIRKYREHIVDLIMAGVPPAEAFCITPADGA